MEIISASKINSYDDVRKSINQGFDLWNDIKLSRDSVVVIKPNLCAIKSHETGTTTDPIVVEEIIKQLKAKFGVSDISIIESDGCQVLADMAFKLLGYEKLAKRLGVKLINLSKATLFTKSFPKNIFLKEIEVPKILEAVDFFISVPKIKTHSDCFISCALKNQYGCNPYWRKTIYHKRLHEAIVDLNVIFKPDMVVVDGIVAMDGRKGPTEGVPLRMNMIILGRDPVAVDHFVAQLMGINPSCVSYIVEAEKRGVGKTDYKAVGIDLNEVRRQFNVKPLRWRNFYGMLQNY